MCKQDSIVCMQTKRMCVEKISTAESSSSRKNVFTQNTRQIEGSFNLV